MTATEVLIINSPSFDEGGKIPAKYTCDGQAVNPALHIDGLPASARSLVVIVEDPDAPSGIFDHWVVWNIAPAKLIAEGADPGVSGLNSGGKTGYFPPCPPRGEHRYYFHVYALDRYLGLPARSSKEELRHAMARHIVAEGVLMGRYQR